MQLNFKEVLDAMIAEGQGDPTFRLINAARPPADYIFATLLPEMPMEEYYVSTSNVTVRATMAMPVGTSSHYPDAGMVDVNSFNKETFKVAHSVTLNEQSLRQLQARQIRLMAAQQGGNTTSKEQLVQTILNFADKLVTQPHLDVAEWLRGQAMSKGSIDWTFNNVRVQVDYGIPSANKFAERTGNNGYGGSTSKFWEDVRKAQELLEYNVLAFFVNPKTLSAIINNDVNALQSQGDLRTGEITLQRKSGGVATSEILDRGITSTIRLIIVRGEGEIPNPAKPGETLRKPFLEDGYMVAVGETRSNGFQIGAGSTPMPDIALGYTHLGPTTEGGMPGRWGRTYVPEIAPWSIVGQGVSNIIPVIDAYKKIVICKTAI